MAQLGRGQPRNVIIVRNPAEQVAPTTNAPAGVAAGTGTAYGASISEAQIAGVASGTGTAYGATCKTSPTAGVAAGTGVAYGPSRSVKPSAGLAAGVGAAYGAAVPLIYYISNSGNDGADGLSSGAAWDTLAHHNAATIVAGSLILLERGGVWRENLQPKAGCTYGAYGAGNKPSIRGSNLAGTWTNAGGGEWYLPSITADPIVVVVDGVLGRRRTSHSFSVALDYWYDDPNDRIYLKRVADPTSAVVEYGVRSTIVGEYPYYDFTLEDLDVRHSRNDPALAFFEPGPIDVAINRCDFANLGGYGIQVNGDATVAVDECTFTDWGIRRETTSDNYAIQAIGADASIDVTDCTFTQDVSLTHSDVMAVINDTGAFLRTFTGNTVNGNDSMDEGVLVYHPGVHATTIEISDNVFNNVGGIAIDLNGLEGGGAAPTVLVHDNIIVNACTNDEADTSAVRLADFTSASTVKVHHNVVDGTFDGANSHAGIRVNAGQGAQIVNNLVQGCDDGIRLDNGFAIRAPSATAINNLSTANRGAAGLVTGSGTLTKSYNLWNGTRTGFTADATDLTDQSPIFVGALDEYRLLSTSPGANAGTTVAGITTTAAPSMGALEESIRPAGVAAGTGAASGATVKTSPMAGVAAGTGSVFGASISIRVSAGVAAGTGAAYGTTVTVAVSPAAGVAAGTGTAYGAAASIKASAGVAAGVGSAFGATTNSATTAGVAAGTGAASGASISLLVPAGNAAGTGTAFNPTVSTVTGTSAAAGVATGTGSAYGASISEATTAGVAAGTGAANGAATSIAGSAGSATGTGSASGPAPSIAVSAGNAAGTGTAYNPTVQTGAFTSANAGVAAGTGTANGATISLAPHAGNAGGTASAYGSNGSVAPTAGVASGTGAASGPSVSGAISATPALGTGQAYDAAAAITAMAGVAAAVGAALAIQAAIGASPGNAVGTGTAYDPTIPGGGPTIVTIGSTSGGIRTLTSTGGPRAGDTDGGIRALETSRS